MAAPRGSRFLRRGARYVHLGAIAIAAIIVLYGQAFGAVLLVAALLVDFVLFKAKIRDESVGFALKLLLLVFSAMPLYSILTTPAHHLQGASSTFLAEREEHPVHRNMKRNQRHHQQQQHQHQHNNNNNHHRKTKKHVGGLDHMPSSSRALVSRVFGGLDLPETDFADLRYRPREEVRSVLKRVFEEVPEFLADMKNPCWRAEADLSKALNEREEAVRKKRRKTLKRRGIEIEQEGEEDAGGGEGDSANLHCLPYAYILGQPKCGTSDLFERLKMHPQIKMPARKEVRWFTRGEFTRSRLDMELEDTLPVSEGEISSHQLLGPGSSIYSFTKSFHNAQHALATHPNTHITIDGGPHTFWWPTQSPDGTVLEEPIPTPQILRELQPNAKFIITLSDPVRRTYSDYYFLDDNLRVHRPGAGDGAGGGGKSSAQFHERAKHQVSEIEACIASKTASMLSDDRAINPKTAESAERGKAFWFRASQICAHDRHKFAVAGWGRLSIGMYAVFLEKWLEHFDPSQFLVVRLEDYDKDPKAYMQRIFDFLNLSQPDFSDWSGILNKHKANENGARRESILPETEKLLRAFYRPYNELLSSMLSSDERFLWTDATESLHDKQQESLEQGGTKISDAEVLALSSSARDGSLERKKQKVVDAKREAAKHAREELRRNWEKNYPQALSSLASNHAVNHHGGGGNTVNSASKLAPPEDVPPPEQKDDDDNDKSQDEVKLKRAKSGIGAKHQPEQGQGQLTLIPHSFSLDGLPLPESDEFNVWLSDGKHIDRDRPTLDEQEAAEQVCVAAFGLDLAALKFLLYDRGIPSYVINNKDAGRGAFHCLALIHVMADAHGKSQVFAMLKGRPNWLSSYIDPPLPAQSHSVLARDIVDGANAAVLKVAAWLLRAGFPPDEPDSGGNTPLHHASVGGLVGLTRFLVENGADVSKRNHEGRTALHYACSYGHALVAEILLAAGGDLDGKDKFGTTPRDIVSAPGPILAADALKYLNITQREPRKIKRMLHPELSPTAKGGWKWGSGGWGTKRLKGFEKDMSCDVDQFWAHEITGRQLFENYVSRMAPVLIRGLMDDWGAAERYAHKNLTAEFGDLRVQVSDIPYSEKFGGSQREDMLLSEYIAEMRGHRMKGGSHPWYVFKGNRIPVDSERTDSLVQYQWTPTPSTIQHAIEYLNPPTARGYAGPKAREIFVNAQWAIGGEGTGAPVHYHNSAWNALVYGAKKWVVYPPHSMIMSNRQILEYFETDLGSFHKRGVQALGCVQTAGDVMIVPEIWGHGVLNIQESVAVATESKANHWRIHPPSDIITKLPNPRLL